jgi:hypothetical protein
LTDSWLASELEDDVLRMEQRLLWELEGVRVRLLGVRLGEARLPREGWEDCRCCGVVP